MTCNHPPRQALYRLAVLLATSAPAFAADTTPPTPAPAPAQPAFGQCEKPPCPAPDLRQMKTKVLVIVPPTKPGELATAVERQPFANATPPDTPPGRAPVTSPR